MKISYNNDQVMWKSVFAEQTSLSLSHFDAQFLSQQNLICRTARGRSTVYFFKLASGSTNEQHVLRGYYRGGLISKLNKKGFLFLGLDECRAYKELELLEFLYNEGINVPKPMAACMTKRFGIMYDCKIITEAISDTSELHEHIQKASLPEYYWQKLGVEIRKLHDLDICHDDINVKNVLICEKDHSVHLIDFDKCRKRTGEYWKKDNLSRLKRSILKQQKLCNGYHFNESNWQVFMDAYHKA